MSTREIGCALLLPTTASPTTRQRRSASRLQHSGQGAQIRRARVSLAIEQKSRSLTAVQTTTERIAVEKALILLANSAVPLLETAFQLTLPIWPRLPQVI
ncbi:MAG: hypothetical protein R2932_04050 [Caldilineaceae bacterium]